MITFSNIRAIITDVEGTTTPPSFVYDILFPYAYQKLPDFVRQNQEQAPVRASLDEVRELVHAPSASVEDIIKILKEWMDKDHKITPLKKLQGMIWELGYQKKQLIGDLYPDVFPLLLTWQEMGIKLYVYSSGSVRAQRLLFGNTPEGDLTPLFSGYFDTEIGGKKEAVSYLRISEAINIPCQQILFLSDSEPELEAASQANFQVLGLHRAEIELSTPITHPKVRNFTEISVIKAQ